MKKIMGLMGYLASDVIFESMEVTAEIETNGIDSDGYKGKQTLGLASDQYGAPCLFIGSSQSTFPLCSCPTINFGEEIKPESISDHLRRLADEIDLVSFKRVNSYKGFDIDVFDTGDKTVWSFEVKKYHRIVEERHQIESEFKAYQMAIEICEFMLNGVKYGG